MTSTSVPSSAVGKRTLQLAVFILLSSCADSAYAQVDVSNPWVRAVAPGRPTAAAYMTLSASRAVTLKSISSPIANLVELRETIIKNDIVRTRHVESLTIAAGQSVELRPGGLHIMLTNLTAPIIPGKAVILRLRFVDTVDADRDITVRVDAQPSPPKK